MYWVILIAYLEVRKGEVCGVGAGLLHKLW
jgi:hypothetical protein